MYLQENTAEKFKADPAFAFVPVAGAVLGGLFGFAVTAAGGSVLLGIGIGIAAGGVVFPAVVAGMAVAMAGLLEALHGKLDIKNFARQLCRTPLQIAAAAFRTIIRAHKTIPAAIRALPVAEDARRDDFAQGKARQSFKDAQKKTAGSPRPPSVSPKPPV